MTTYTRRDALAGAVTLGAVGVAGCVTGSGDTPDPENGSSPDDGDNNSSSPNDSENDTATPDDSGNGTGNPADSTGSENTVVDASIETTDATCGNPDDGSATVSVTETTVTIEGSRGGLSNPCQEATLGAVGFESGELTVEVGTQSTAGPNEACVDCVGTVEYVATIELEASIPADDVRVTGRD